MLQKETPRRWGFSTRGSRLLAEQATVRCLVNLRLLKGTVNRSEGGRSKGGGPANRLFPKDKAFTFISGGICLQCATRPYDELMAAIIGYLRAVKPDTTIGEMGTA